MNSYITLLQFINIIHSCIDSKIEVYYFTKKDCKIIHLFEGNLQDLKEFFVDSYPSDNNKYLYYQISYIYTRNNVFEIVLRDNAYDFKENL